MIDKDTNFRVLPLDGHVGFDSLPDQQVNKAVQKGFVFNILCVGKKLKEIGFIWLKIAAFKMLDSSILYALMCFVLCRWNWNRQVNFDGFFVQHYVWVVYISSSFAFGDPGFTVVWTLGKEC